VLNYIGAYIETMFRNAARAASQTMHSGPPAPTQKREILTFGLDTARVPDKTGALEPPVWVCSPVWQLQIISVVPSRVFRARSAGRQFGDATTEGEFIETIMAAQGALERKQNGRQVAQKM